MAIVRIDKNNPDPKTLVQAAETLISGGLLVYPTDTAYGLGVDATNDNAIKKLYELKGRAFSKPTHVVVRDWKMVTNLTQPGTLAKALFTKHLPGPLTIVIAKKKDVSDVLTAGRPTLGIRIPNSPITQKLSKLVDFPYTTTSANRSSEATPYSLPELNKVLDLSKIDLVLDAGPLPKTPPSTIVDTTTEPPTVIRNGPIKISL